MYELALLLVAGVIISYQHQVSSFYFSRVTFFVLLSFKSNRDQVELLPTG